MADLTPTLAEKTPGGYVKSGQIGLLLDAVRDRIKTRPLIAANQIKTTTHHSADLWNYLGQIINKNLGMLIVVRLLPSGTNGSGCGACLRQTNLVVRVLENVLFNQGRTGTKVPALTVAEAVAEWLHGYIVPSSSGVLHSPTLWLDDQQAIQESTDERMEVPGGVVSWEVRLQTHVVLQVVD